LCKNSQSRRTAKTQRHSRSNLCSEIEKILKEFNISKKQIYSTTTDNGKNMINAVSLLSDDEATSLDDDEFDDNEELIKNLKVLNNICKMCGPYLAIRCE